MKPPARHCLRAVTKAVVVPSVASAAALVSVVSEVRKPVVVDPTAVAVKMQNAAVAAASVVKAAKTVAAEVNKSHLK